MCYADDLYLKGSILSYWTLPNPDTFPYKMIWNGNVECLDKNIGSLSGMRKTANLTWLNVLYVAEGKVYKTLK